MSLLSRFERKFTPEPNTGCWLWTGSVMEQGYGLIGVDGRTRRAHRVSYALFVGSPSGMQVCHRCDNTSCVNPSHLFLGTQTDNMRDCVSKNRKAVGSRCGSAKLSERDVLEVLKRHQDGESMRSIGRVFSVSHKAVSAIVNGKTWLHITRGGVS